ELAGRPPLPRPVRLGHRRRVCWCGGRGAAVPRAATSLAAAGLPPVRRLGDHRDPPRRRLLHLEPVAVVITSSARRSRADARPPTARGTAPAASRAGPPPAAVAAGSRGPSRPAPAARAARH